MQLRGWQYGTMLLMALAAGHSIGMVIVLVLVDALSR